MKSIKKFLALLFLTIMLYFSTPLSAQIPNDFWTCFEKVTRLSQLQPFYPVVPPQTTRTHILMNHGIVIPSLAGHVFETNMTVAVREKSQILSEGSTEFFLIHEAKFLPGQAFFDLLYYYNFNGNYLPFKTAKVNLALNNNTWSITNYIVE